jgi:hypothetical protein
MKLVTAIINGVKAVSWPENSAGPSGYPAIVRSAKVSVLRSDAAAPTEPPLERHDDSKRESALVSKQEAPLVESPPTAPQDDRKTIANRRRAITS